MLNLKTKKRSHLDFLFHEKYLEFLFNNLYITIVNIVVFYNCIII